MTMPATMQNASKQIASDMTRAVIDEMFGSPILAYYELTDKKLDSVFLQRASKWTHNFISNMSDGHFVVVKSGKDSKQVTRYLPFKDGSVSDKDLCLAQLNVAAVALDKIRVPATVISKARTHLDVYAKELGAEIIGKEKSNVTQKATTEGPTGPYTFPRNAPAPEGQTFTPPGNKTESPGDSTETQKTNDESLFPPGTRLETFTPPGDKAGTPADITETQKEQDQSTFPGNAPAPGFSPNAPATGKDLNTSVTPAKQPPETERHQVDLHKEQNETEKASAGPAAPWLKKSSMASTPGLEFMSNDDGHVGGIEKSASEADLYHQRYAKRKDVNDLKAQCECFKSERACMGTLEGCASHIDPQRAYAKEVFAYSYGQVKRNLSKALRSFANDPTAPDMESYHSLSALKADLLGETSSRFFADAKFSAQMANWVAGKDEEDDSSEPEPGNDKDTEEAKGDLSEMKANDVKAAILLLGGDEQYANAVVALASKTEAERNDCMLIAQTLNPSAPLMTAPTMPVNPTISSQVANVNLVGAGVRQTAGGTAKAECGGVTALSMFSAKKHSPIFD